MRRRRPGRRQLSAHSALSALSLLAICGASASAAPFVDCAAAGVTASELDDFMNAPPLRPPASAKVTVHLGSDEAGDMSRLLRAFGAKSLNPSMLEALGLPHNFIEYFKPGATPGKGNFRLSVENGGAPLRAARIQFIGSGRERMISEVLLEDYHRALTAIPDTELWISVNHADLPTLRSELASAKWDSIRDRVRINDADSHVTYVWAQDTSKPLDSRSPRTLVPASTGRSALYEPIVRSLERERLAGVDASRLNFQGGDVIVGDKNIFVGPDVVEELKKRGLNAADSLRALQAEFGKPVIPVGVRMYNGDLKSVDFHIDLKMAIVKPGGRETILVESPRKLIEGLLQGRKIEDIPHQTTQEFYENLVRGPDGTAANRPLTLEENALVNVLKRTSIDRLKSSQDQLDEVAEGFRARGYAVEFVPGLSIPDGARTSGQLEIFNWTNSVFSGVHAIVPRLNIAPLDQMVRQQLRRLGYTSIIDSDAPRLSLRHQGGTRCLTETYRQPSAEAH